MNRVATEKIDPWRVPIVVAQIPDTGLHRDVEADAAAREAMAELAGLREVLSMSASFDVIPKGDGRFQVIHAKGHVRPMEKPPKAYLIGRHLGRILGANIFDPLRMGPRIRDPDLAERDPAFPLVRFLGRNADMIECFFHLNLRLWSRASLATETTENTEKKKRITKARKKEIEKFFFALSCFRFFVITLLPFSEVSVSLCG